jgi:hypothetical protein
MMAAIGWAFLERALIACDGLDSTLARAVGRELKGKLSIAMFAVGMAIAFVQPWLAIALYIAVAIIWFVPDRRIESLM